MVKRIILSVGTILLIILWIRSGICESNNIEIVVFSDAESAPDSISISGESDVVPSPLEYNEEIKGYVTSLTRPTFLVATSSHINLGVPYRIAGRWGDDQETLYLYINFQTPERVELIVYHRTFVCNQENLNKIGGLENDVKSLLKKYTCSRFYHRTWRHQLLQPSNDAALRSARIWFDSAVKLVQVKPKIMRMDPEIIDIVTTYEEEASMDGRFNRYYRRYFPKGYINGILNDLTARPYSFVSQIPILVRRGNFKEAKELNDCAISMFSNETNRNKRIITKLQGINSIMLKKNADFINSKLDITS